jgi:hypothetical protein
VLILVKNNEQVAAKALTLRNSSEDRVGDSGGSRVSDGKGAAGDVTSGEIAVRDRDRANLSAFMQGKKKQGMSTVKSNSYTQEQDLALTGMLIRGATSMRDKSGHTRGIGTMLEDSKAQKTPSENRTIT